MSHENCLNATDRRTFLQAGAVATASAMALNAQNALAQDVEPIKVAPVLPKRALGKTGVEITMLNQGAVRGSNLDRILRVAFASGIRTFDTAKVYGSEPNFKKWFEQAPEVRKQIFLVTKDMPRAPKEMIKMLDERLETLGTREPFENPWHCAKWRCLCHHLRRTDGRTGWNQHAQNPQGVLILVTSAGPV